MTSARDRQRIVRDARPGMTVLVERYRRDLGATRPVRRIVARVEDGRVYAYDEHWGSPETATDVTSRLLGLEVPEIDP